MLLPLLTTYLCRIQYMPGDSDAALLPYRQPNLTSLYTDRMVLPYLATLQEIRLTQDFSDNPQSDALLACRGLVRLEGGGVLTEILNPSDFPELKFLKWTAYTRADCLAVCRAVRDFHNRLHVDAIISDLEEWLDGTDYEHLRFDVLNVCHDDDAPPYGEVIPKWADYKIGALYLREGSRSLPPAHLLGNAKAVYIINFHACMHSFELSSTSLKSLNAFQLTFKTGSKDPVMVLQGGWRIIHNHGDCKVVLVK